MRTALALLAALVALATAGTAAAATPPSASTGPVGAVGSTTATVGGTVNPNGTATSWFVEYGTTTGYGSKTGAASAGSGTANVPVSGSLSGLKPGTTYHYRIVATSSAGTANGADGILTTTAAPSVSTDAATGVTATSATLTGSVNPNSRPTSWYFEYGTSTGYGSRTPTHDAGSGGSSTSVSATITGLGAGRTYHFRLVATSDAGTSRGADKAFVASTRPSVTTGSASALGDTSAKATGSVDPNGLATTAWFEYGTSTAYGSRTAATSVGAGTGSRGVSATLDRLSGAATYHVRLVASNSSGTTYGADTAVTTTGRPRASTSAATAVGGVGATLNGTINPDGHATTWYAEWGTGTAYGNRTPTQSLGGGTNTVNVSVPLGGLLAGTTYHFRIVAANASGTSTSGDTTFTTAGPGVTLAASAPVRLTGQTVRLMGQTITQQPNEQVTVWAQRFGEASFVQIATVLTGAGGAWSIHVAPPAATTYKAQVAAGPSPTLTIGVRPTVVLHAVHGGFRVTVHGPVSYRGQSVLLQRKSGTGWRDLGFRKLGAWSRATWAPHLGKGRWALRVLVGRRPGILAGTSNTFFVRVR